MLTGGVAHVDGAAADGTCSRVQPPHLMQRVEHVPIGQADLAEESGVERHVDEVDGV